MQPAFLLHRLNKCPGLSNNVFENSTTSMVSSTKACIQTLFKKIKSFPENGNLHLATLCQVRRLSSTTTPVCCFSENAFCFWIISEKEVVRLCCTLPYMWFDPEDTGQTPLSMILRHLCKKGRSLG